MGNHSAAVPGQGHGYQVSAELPALTHDGRYTCTAANSLGRAEASVYLFRFRGATGVSAMAMLLGALGLKVLLLLGVLASHAARRRLGGCACDLSGCKGRARALLSSKTLWLITWHDTARMSFLHLCRITFLPTWSSRGENPQEAYFAVRKLWLGSGGQVPCLLPEVTELEIQTRGLQKGPLTQPHK
jgi:hypothetical protein